MKRSLRHLTLALAALFALVATVSAYSDVVPLGGEIVVNTITAGTQGDPDVAIDAAGNFVVTWRNSPTFFAGEVAGQLFDASGLPLGNEFQINTFTNGFQALPKVAMDATGNFVVVWTSSQQFPPASVSVVGRRYDSAGTPLDGEFEVSVGFTGAFADVAMAADGSFLVLWQGRPAGTSGPLNLYVRLYDQGGIPQTAPTVVSPAPSNSFSSGLTATPDGGWLVAWSLEGDDIFARRLDATATPLGPETRIGSNGYEVALAAGGDRIVAAWPPGNLQLGGPPALLFDGSFTPVTGLLQSSTAPALPGQDVAVAMDATGGFAIAWTEFDLTENNGTLIVPTRDGSEATILARVFNAWGSPAGGDFVVNTTTAGFQALPSLAMSPSGRLVAAWVGPAASPQDDVFAQIFVPNAAPVAQCQNQTVSALSSCTANASIDNGSFDPDSGDTLTLVQIPAGPYAVGSTSVILTVIDSNGISDSCSATVNVVDTTAPELTCPADITTDAAIGSPGAAVSFVAGAPDACSNPVDVTYSPASGSVFPFGATAVLATATDSSGNSASCTFTVTVLTPLEQIDAVTTEIDDLVTAGVLAQNTANALINKLEQAAAKIDAGQLGPACNKLDSFVNQVNANINNGSLTAAQGQSLIDSVTAIQTNLGC